ncbi:hypothetical protein NIES37_10730 [Tolypothrix tenuis PCC 7101]|uniref:Uncharacterized protein n=1 Tax=Tolypothrix tenuis PCC 7101 TaxID=231146 RepID=A0A1Z4MUI3_9CYAN|nr:MULTISPECIES: hypothetical protein [unclassified Tolypothrix]MBD2210219.1 hypothetical protein [Nostoc linckia FACHB-104]MBD2237878.1 hypothetical protein [Aulosira sp. FACHB-113]MBD2338640.1 hypothetical protein [Calothrix sp. FACHB-156]BAY32830.1 hypothetical protein NIES2107_47240 [Nostoc carneum NIES-2107]BAY93133.1 hypothetical protein NIES3275_51700 [Microchaete diplosiphon NIES-3275]BAY97136.1 hypothetical protein NIES37_10730 [Tolypothrix tenuis PCC 7101]BAZ72356.1 hypothetical pr
MEMPQRVSIRYKDASYNTNEIRLKTFRLAFQLWEEESKPKKTELYEFISSCLKQIDRQDRFMISFLFLELADMIRDSALNREMKEVLIKTAFREFSCAVSDFESSSK